MYKADSKIAEEFIDHQRYWIPWSMLTTTKAIVP